MRVAQQRVAEIMNKGRLGDRVSKRVDLALSLLILANLIAVCLESVDSIAAIYGPQLLAFEMISVSIFAAEYVLRLWSAPKRSDLDGETATAKRLQYMFSFTGIVDLLALLPSFLQWLIPGADLRWLRVLRMIRLLKLSHYSSALEDLISAIYEERRAFGAALYLLGIALFLASALIYVAENKVQPQVFSSIPETMVGDHHPDYCRLRRRFSHYTAWETHWRTNRIDGSLYCRATHWNCRQRFCQPIAKTKGHL